MQQLLTKQRPLIISGPCSAETEEQTLATCRAIAATGKAHVLRAGIWKPRTKPGSFEGSGLKGLAWMAKAKAETGMPIATEVANAKHVESALEFGMDMLWIGARTTVNPFSVQEIADALRGTNIPILVKNPMNPDIDLWCGAVERLHKVGLSHVGLIHRGFSSFGLSAFRNPPMWHLAVDMMMRMPEVPMICDPSHIAGSRELLQEVCQQAADLNYDGLIVESHCCPADAWSDASQQVTPTDLVSLLDSIIWRSENVERPEYVTAINVLRGQIDQFDAQIFELLSRRMQTSEKIGEVKRDNNVTILQTRRWDDIVKRVLDSSDKLQLSKEFLSILLNAIHMESIGKQNAVMNSK